MNKFGFDDVVRVSGGVPAKRIGAKAWIVGITQADERFGSYYDRFPPGTIYTVEFEDGDSLDVVEMDLVGDEKGDICN